MSILFKVLTGCLCMFSASLVALQGERVGPEFGIKSGMGCLETGKDAYPAFSGGLTFKPQTKIYGVPFILGIDSMAYADVSRIENGAWGKMVALYQVKDVPILKNFYIGSGMSLGSVYKWKTEDMSDEKTWEAEQKLVRGATLRRRWDAHPGDRLMWEKSRDSGLFVEGLLGYEWFPSFHRNVKSLSGSVQEGYVPLRMFVEISVHHPVWTHTTGSLSALPYLHLDLGVGF